MTGLLDPEGPVAAAERLILFNATAIMLVVVIPVIAMICGVAWHYRASNGRAAYRPEWLYSGRIELVVWSIPSLVVILLAGVAWIGSHRLDPRAPLDSSLRPLRIQVVSLDWKWLFIYPEEGISLVNEVVVPTATPVEFTLTSATVMNAFFVPQLGSMIYTMPGMTTHLNLLADHAGSYAGFSAQFSGDGFSDMRFAVQALDRNRYAAWLADARAKGKTLDAHAYVELTRPGIAAAPALYRDVNPLLFEHMVHDTGAPR